MIRTTSKQVPGLSAEDAIAIRAALAYAKAAPFWAEDAVWESLGQWLRDCHPQLADRLTGPTDDGFLWLDGDDIGEWEHLCC